MKIVATGAGKDSDIHINGADVSGKGGTYLIADNDIYITPAEQHHKERSTHQSSGVNVGAAIKVSNGVAAGVTVGGNYGKGYGNGDETSFVASHVGDANSKTTINAGGDANLIGSQLKGKGIHLNAENLNIESLQDKSTYKGKQMNVAGSVTVGYGFAASGSYSQSKINADHASVNEQAGIYAGDEGYDINVNKHTDLKGAIITSTQKAEDENKNRFSTGTLSHSDIENHSNYSGSSFGVSGSVAMNFETPLKEGAAQSSKQATDKNGNPLYTDSQGNTTVNATNADGSTNKVKAAEGLASLQADYGMGYGSDKDNQSSITKSGINTQNITIKDEAAQQRLTGKTAAETIADIKTDITTDNAQAQAQSGKLDNRFDKDKVQKELDLQREVTESFGKTVTETGTLIADKVSEAARKKKYEAAVKLEQAQNALKENDSETNRTLLSQAKANFDSANKEAKEWETGGSQRRILDSALNVLSTALGGRPVAEVIASGLSPTVNYQIKEATTDKNGNVNTTLNLTAHALWGAVEAYAGNRNVAAGAAGAVTGEAAANIIAETLYDKSPNQLSQEEKLTVSALSQVAAGIAGGTVANSSDGAIIAAKTAKEAVENNAEVPIFGNVTPEIFPQAQGEAKLVEVKTEIDKMIREEHPIVMQTFDGLYAIVSATGKVIYVTREVAMEVVPMLVAPEVAGALKLGKAVQFVATHPRVVTLSEKAVEGISKAATSAKSFMTPGQVEVVKTSVQGIQNAVQPLSKMTAEQYAKQAAIGTAAGATAQYVVNGEVNTNNTLKTGLMAPYMLNLPAGMAVLIGSIDTAISAASEGKSQLNEQVNYAQGTTLGSIVEKMAPEPLKPMAPYLGFISGEFMNQFLNYENKKGDKK
ncbi:hypothetical protein BKK53_07205 [Rodentibacter trehalosifermentans]|nr:hemagglutinin repeat-containing protein [Rodentibacter trehalosifermentans]OOF51488.1 hypothetical protein BKK53_07205 [Rodentibacter trehalosifermentans]